MAEITHSNKPMNLANVRSYVCLSCERTYYLTHSRVEKNGQRCTWCGGPGEETESSLKRRGKSKPPKNSDGLGVKRHECPDCGMRFRAEIAMQIHREETHGAPRQSGKFVARAN